MEILLWYIFNFENISRDFLDYLILYTIFAIQDWLLKIGLKNTVKNKLHNNNNF